MASSDFICCWCLCGVISDLSHGLSQDLRPRGADVRKEELADMVDKEMAATSSAIEDAVLRMDVSVYDAEFKPRLICYDFMGFSYVIQEILSQARRDTSGVKLEVNQRLVWDIVL